MFEQENTRVALDALYNVDLDKLKHQELAGFAEFDFASITEKVKEIIGDIKKIDENQKNIRITVNHENSLRDIANGLNSRVIEPSINFIFLNNANASQQYGEIKSNLENISDNFLDRLNDLLTQIEVQSLTPDKIKLKFETFKNIEKAANKIIDNLNNKKEEAEKIIRQASGIQASEKSSDIFSIQALEHSKSATRWLLASLVTFFILVLLILFLFYGWRPFDKFVINAGTVFNPYYIQAIIFKLLLLSSAYFILHQCVKNYKINRHLYVTNKHRQNALTVYPTISVAGEDPETRSVVVSQAAKQFLNKCQVVI